jgi:hypothetical protein
MAACEAGHGSRTHRALGNVSRMAGRCAGAVGLRGSEHGVPLDRPGLPS